MRPPFVPLALALVPAMLLAHPGHTHHVMGFVQAVDPNRIDVQDLAGKITPCLITPATKFLRGDTYLNVPGIKPGERIMIDYEEKQGGWIALKVRLGKAE